LDIHEGEPGEHRRARDELFDDPAPEHVRVELGRLDERERAQGSAGSADGSREDQLERQTDQNADDREDAGLRCRVRGDARERHSRKSLNTEVVCPAYVAGVAASRSLSPLR
jgi:hypothetical protein